MTTFWDLAHWTCCFRCFPREDRSRRPAAEYAASALPVKPSCRSAGLFRAGRPGDVAGAAESPRSAVGLNRWDTKCPQAELQRMA
jgi:hypothetical protein